MDNVREKIPMPKSNISNVRVAGMSGAIPSLCGFNDNVEGAGKAGVDPIIGVRSKHIAQDGLCTSDLCCAAGDRLLTDLEWPRESVEALIFVTQTPDYLLPATGCSLQQRLGLSATCAAFDVNLGCSGFIYGLWLGGLMVSSGIQRLLLLVGDTVTRIVAPNDPISRLFGDAGTATALEYSEGAPAMHLELGTNGAGREHLFVPAGGFRNPRSAKTCLRTAQEDGGIRSQEDLYMNGSELFLFALTRVPPLVRCLLEASGWKDGDVEGFVFNQTSLFIMEHLAMRMKIPPERLILSLEEFGNTSSAGIPLTMTTRLRDRLQSASSRLVLAGFGGGYSWGGAALICGPMCVPELVLCSLPE